MGLSGIEGVLKTRDKADELRDALVELVKTQPAFVKRKQQEHAKKIEFAKRVFGQAVKEAEKRGALTKKPRN